MTGSRMLKLPEARSIFARSVRLPSGNSPFFMRSNRSRFSSTERSRYGETAGLPISPRHSLKELLRRQVADVGKAFFDEFHGKLVVLFKIVRAVEETVAPVKAQPVDIGLDGVDIFGVFLRGVGVVHAQVVLLKISGEALAGDAHRGWIRGHRRGVRRSVMQPACRSASWLATSGAASKTAAARWNSAACFNRWPWRLPRQRHRGA